MITTNATLGRRNVAAFAFGLLVAMGSNWALPPVSWANPDFVVIPTRLVIMEGQSDSQFRVVNSGTEPLEISLAVTSMSMRIDGILEPRDANEDPGSAAPYLLVAPRSSRILPGVSQTFRLIVHAPEKSGEYRSHLLIRLTTAPDAVTQFAVTLPVIVRTGRLHARVALQVELLPPAESPERIQAAIRLSRTGSASSYGDLRFQLHLANGETALLGLRRGVAVYAENAERIFNLSFPVPAGVNLIGAQLVVTYQDEENGQLRESVPLQAPHSPRARDGWAWTQTSAR